MTALAAAFHPSLRSRTQDENQYRDEKTQRKTSDLVNSKSFADFRFKTYDGGKQVILFLNIPYID